MVLIHNLIICQFRYDEYFDVMKSMFIYPKQIDVYCCPSSTYNQILLSMCDKKSYTISTTSCQLNKHYWLMCSGVCLNISLVEPTCHQMLLCYVSTSSCLDLSYFSQNVLTCGIQIVVYYKVVNNKPSVCIFVGTDSFKISAIKSMKAHENGIFA